MYGEIKNYRMLIVIPIAILVFSLFKLFTTEINKGVDLEGGIQISFLFEKEPNPKVIEKILKHYRVKVRIAKGYEKTTVFLIYKGDYPPEEIIKKLRENGYEIDDYSVQKISPILAEKFYGQMLSALAVAFIFMSVVVFFIFRKLLPSFYVLFAVASDVIEAFVFSQLLGIELTIPVISALLLLIGYSVDTDILLTSKVLKGSGSLSEKLNSAFKTGITMSLTTLGALASVVLLSSSAVLKHIATVLLFGIVFDIINTWLANGVALRWWAERKGF